MEISRLEHPKPQMERKNWINLNGIWQFAFDFGNSGIERGMFSKESFDKEINVPFCPESVLSGIEYKDFMNAVWYKRKIDITSENLKNRVFIHFGAVDYKATLYVNGKEIGSHSGGYVSFKFEITEALKEGVNDITLLAVDDIRSGRQPRGKQSRIYPSVMCDYTRTTGIWQTVWLEFVPYDYIEKVKYYPDIEQCEIHVKALLKGEGTLKIKASFEGRPCGEAKACVKNGVANLSIKLTEKHLWEVGRGNLYDLELFFNNDYVKSYCGLREVSLDGYKFLINGKSVFQRLVLDQGFYPDGIYTAPTDAALKNDIMLSLAMGFNGARLHEKVFEERFLYYCDKLGYIVWGEHGNWGLDMSNLEALRSFLPEWLEIIDRDFNHPAIIGWCPFNETWDYDLRGQINDILSIVYKTTKQIDWTRPCIDTSGNYHVITDIYDVHNYNQNPVEFAKYYEDFKNGGDFKDDHSYRQRYTKGLPLFISEYGGIKWYPLDDKKAWGYGEAPKSKEEFVERYKGLTEAILSNKNIFGFCYTQLYDVEQEVNGLYYYNREQKFDPKLIKEINTTKATIE